MLQEMNGLGRSSSSPIETSMIIIMTARFSKWTVLQRAWSKGANDYVVKTVFEIEKKFLQGYVHSLDLTQMVRTNLALLKTSKRVEYRDVVEVENASFVVREKSLI